MIKNIWDWLKQINYIKADPSSFSDKDWDIWNSYMVHRFISMNQDYVDIVNEVQQMHPQSKKEIYSIFQDKSFGQKKRVRDAARPQTKTKE